MARDATPSGPQGQATRPPRLRVRTRFFWGIAPTVALAILFGAMVPAILSYISDKAELQKRLTGIISSAAIVTARAVEMNDLDTASVVLASIMSDRDVVFACITSRDGHPMIELGARPTRGFIETRNLRYVEADQLVDGGKIMIGVTTENALALLMRRLAHSAVAAAFAALAIWVGISIIFEQTVGRPVGRIRNAIARWRAGKAPEPDPERRDDELGAVMDAFLELHRECMQEEQARSAITADLERQVSNRTDALRIARDRAEAASRAKSTFLASVSHEIRTPMNAILGIAQSLLRTAEDPLHRRQLDVLLDSGRTLTELLDDILDQAKIEAGRLDLAESEGDLGELLNGLAELWTPRAREKGIALELELDNSLPAHAVFDPVRVRQCISNLISNAVKFTEKGSVSMRASAERLPGGRVALAVQVSDTGPGIDPLIAPRLFEPFSQAEALTARQFGGTGLGLSITRRLARMMGGDVTFTTEPGKGTTFELLFTLSLRRSKGRAGGLPSEQVERGVPEVDLSGVRVLVVDDVATNRLVARLMLSATGADVEEAPDGYSALKALERARFDLVLLDLHMPGIDGFDTLKLIRESGATHADIPTVILTADAEERAGQRLAALSPAAFIVKPIDFAKAARVIARVIGRPVGTNSPELPLPPPLHQKHWPRKS